MEPNNRVNVVPVGISGSGRQSVSYRRYTFAVIVFVAFAVFGFFAAHLMAYLGGTRNDYPFMVKPAFIYMLVLGLGAVAFTLYGLAELLFVRPRSLSHAAVELTLAIIPLLTCVGIIFLSKHMPPSYLKGFRQWTTANADIEAIQRWLATDGVSHERGLSKEDLPPEFFKSLGQFKPLTLVFRGKDPNESTVRVSWGVLDESWGLVVGPPTMTMPKAGRTDTSKTDWEYRLPVKAGAYVYDYMHD